MKTRLTAAVLSAAMLFANAAAMPAQAQDLTQVFSSLSADQSASLSYAMAGLGIADYNALIAMVQATALPPQSRIRDLNSDSVCDTNDVIFLMNFLQGKVNYAYNYSDMDVTNDCVIDEADTRAYLAYYTYQSITNGTPVPFQSGHTAGKSYQTQTIQYNRFNAQTGAYLGSYYLTTPAPTQNSSSTQTTVATEYLMNTITPDPDDRQVDWSERSVVKLMGSGSSPLRGTGFIIGAHLIATAAHCMKQKSASGSIIFRDISTVRVFDDDYDPITGTGYFDVTPLEVHMPANADGENYINDYAVITVPESVDLSDYVDFSFGVPLYGIENTITEISVTGFPTGINYSGVIPGTIVNSGTVHTKLSSTGYINPKALIQTSHQYYNTIHEAFESVPDNYLMYWIHASNGNSGSPVYYTHTYSGATYMSVLSILTNTPSEVLYRQYHVGPRVTSDILLFYYNNPYLC